MTLAILHLFNCMLRTDTFPQEYKTARIIPLKKKDKDKHDIDSFHPVSNLNPVEKCLEQLLKNRINKFLKVNKVTPGYHHGAHKGHSTVTAAQIIQHSLQTNKIHNHLLLPILNHQLYNMTSHK